MKPLRARTIRLATVALLALLPGSQSTSGTFTVSIDLPGKHIEFSKSPQGTDVNITGTSVEYVRMDAVGDPALPYRVINVLLPWRTEIADFRAVASYQVIDDTFVPRLATLPVPDEGKKAVPQTVGRARDASDGIFPTEAARHLGTSKWHGRSIASFAVYPIRLDGSKLLHAKQVTLRLRTRASTRSEPTIRPERLSRGFAQSINSAIRSRVINPEALNTYTPMAGASGKSTTDGFAATVAPSLDGSPVEYVIITIDEMKDEFQRLADWKTAKGTPTVVRTVSWIRANYRNGSDTPETIRRFIRDAYTKWGTQWVLLGGDVGQVPPRYAYSAYFTPTDVLADIYFACLDGDWNADHDEVWGEHPTDSNDLWAEVYVGRLPAGDATQARTMIDKVIAYETPSDFEYTDKVLFLAEVLFPAPWNQGEPWDLDGAGTAEIVRVKHMLGDPLRITQLYENYLIYSGSILETAQTSIDSINAGYNHVFHVGHGFRFNIHCGDADIEISDVDAFTNTNRYMNFNMINCTAAAFDYDCLAERMLINPTGGAVSVIGATNSAYPFVSVYYMCEYSDLVFDNDVVHIGEAFHRSRETRTPIAMGSDNADYWTHLIYVLLGDPEMSLWTTTVDTMTVAHTDSVEVGAANITVNVISGGSPQDSAVVCLWKEGDDYQVQEVDGSGNATFNFATETPGSVSVVVTARNRARHQGYIVVYPGTGALLTVDGITIDDDSTGGTWGNGDGAIDAGEIVDIYVDVTNTGDVMSIPSALTLSTSDPYVAIVDTFTTLGGVAIEAAATTATAFRISVAPGAPDDHTATFSVDIVDTLGANWTDTFVERIHAPSLEVVELRFDDSLPYGDGNGVLANGEEFLLFCRLKNYGTGTASGLTATLSALDTGTTVIDSMDSYIDIITFSDADNTIGFRIAETSVFVENFLELVVTDMHGNELRDTLELRPPLSPSSLVLDTSLGVNKMLVTWTGSASPDAARYHVYRSTTQGGPYTRATVDAVDHATFTDTQLAASTRYYYVATTLDDKGNESGYSGEESASTTPSQLLGWPNSLDGSSSNTVTIGDIDGDGNLEVVVGNDKMYVWRTNGQEYVDGDEQSLTYGVFSTLGDDYFGPAALANIDTVPGHDIVAAAYTSRQVYIFNYTGAVLPGWPQSTLFPVQAAMSVGDLDGDGDLEIVAVDEEGYIYAWHDDGTEFRDGDADSLTTGVFYRLPDTPWIHYQSPALADLDGDGSDEILIGGQNLMFYVLKSDGTDFPGWPRALGGYPGGSPAVGDIDNDGDLEIIVFSQASAEIRALHHDNTQLWLRWSPMNTYFHPSAALGDITGDGKLETFFVTSTGQVWAIDYQGNTVPGWPVIYSSSTYSQSSPVIADVTGDGTPDILLGHEDRFIMGWNASGSLLPGFPLVTQDAIRGTPTVTDLDGDGDVEIVIAGFDRTVYVWDLSAAYNKDASPWPTFQANNHRNGLLGFVVPSSTPGSRPTSATTQLVQNYPNPFNPSTTIVFDVGAGPARRISLVIYNVTGARVQTLADGSFNTGRYTRAWDGRNALGARVSSGVYFYRLSDGYAKTALTKKMVLLK